jgi:hypothetical protein
MRRRARRNSTMVSAEKPTRASAGVLGQSLILPAEGGCQCGNIRYRVMGEPVWLAVCHCSECKRHYLLKRSRRCALECPHDSRRATLKHRANN